MLALLIAGCGDEDPLPNISPSTYADVTRTRPMESVDIDVLANDGDPDGGIGNLTVELVTQPANATASVVANRVRVVPQAGFVGRVTFMYRARDAQGASSGSASITVDVAPTIRALLVTNSASQPLERWSVADASGAWPVASNVTTCGIRSNFVRNPSGTQVVIMTCGSERLRHNLVSLHPREQTVWSREIAHDAQLHPSMVLSDDGSRVVVLEYDGDPNTLPGATNYELLAIDTATGAVQRRLAIEGVEMVHGFTGAGPAHKIYLQVRDNSSGTVHPAILTADLEAGTLARLETANPYNVLADDSLPYSNGDGLLFQYADQRLYSLDSLTPSVLLFPWEDPDAYLYPRVAIPNSASAVVLRSLSTQNGIVREYWTVPLRDPEARHVIVQNVEGMTGDISMKPDGRRMLFALAPLASANTLVHEVSTEDGSLFGTVGPSGGIYWLREFEYFGPDGDVLVSTGDPVTYERVSIIRHDQRLELVPMATDIDYFGIVYREADADGAGIAFSLSLAGGNGRFRAYVTDVNLPGVSLPLGPAPTDDEDVYVFAALGAPLPP